MKSQEFAQRFHDKFGVRCRLFKAPGRVNLIGEHTDYNAGFVLPLAIGMSTFVAVAPRSDGKLLIRSERFSEHADIESDDFPQKKTGAWHDYVVGVAGMLRQAGLELRGANLLIGGDVPIGAGLSSSAALEVASALALISLQEESLKSIEIAKLCQRAENEFVGTQCGIMDQFISCLGQAGHALLLDCRSLEFQPVPIPEGLTLVICNTMVKHTHAGGEYNRRRLECEEGVKLQSQWHPGVRALRDITSEQLQRHVREMPPTIYKRCSHVVQENQRVMAAARLLAANDVSAVGELLRKSHVSLRDLYEVSCPELDTMVEVAEGLPGYYGGRMTGGGFGGCTVNLVAATEAQGFAEQIAERYRRLRGIQPDVYVCSAADGAREVNVI